MKVVSIQLFYRKGSGDSAEAHDLAKAFDLSSFGFFQRSTVKEWTVFVSRTVALRTNPGARQSVTHDGRDTRYSPTNSLDYKVHVHARMDNCVGVVVCDHEYDSRVAFSLLTKACDAFKAQYQGIWASEPPKTLKEMPFPELDEWIKQYQKPEEADNLSKMQKELDDTKIILHETIESVLERGQKLDSLVEKSDDLSRQSCCIVM